MNVSIHATLAGGDTLVFAGQTKVQYVSIHATLAGGDNGKNADAAADTEFLSTPPSRVATKLFTGGREPTKEVSIHATLAGGDGSVKCVTSTQASFYPRHPRGWRRR